MSMLDRKLLRELYRSSGLLLAITSIIAVGVTCFVAMQSAYHNLDSARRDYYRRTRLADFWIDVKKAPRSELEKYGRARIGFYATADLEGVERPINGLVLSLPDQRQPVINDIVLRQGGYFTEQRDNEVIVNDAFARAHHLYPGQSIHLLLNNRREELRIVGTAISSEFTYLVGPGALTPDPEHFGVFYVKRTYAEEVFDMGGAANQVVGQLPPELRDHPDDILRRMENELDEYGVFAVTPRSQQTSNQFLTGEIEGLGSFATVVPLIFLSVAALVLNVLITRLARQQRMVMGTLKALGYSDWQVFLHFLKFGLVVGLAGGLLGDVAGYLASAGMTLVYKNYFEFPDLPSRLYWYTHLIGIAVSLVFAVAGSLYGAWGVLRLQPAEAMRSERPRQGRAIWLERIGPLWRLLGAQWRIALRNIFRHRLRTGAGLFAATMGAGLLVTGFMMMEAMNYFMEFQFELVSRSDVEVTFAEEQGYDALNDVRHLPGVDYAEPVLNVACTFRHGPYRRKGGISGLLENSRLTRPHDAQRRPILLSELPPGSLVITRSLADRLHVALGDRLVIEPVQGEREAFEMPVARIADSYMGEQSYARLGDLAEKLNEEFLASGAQLKIDPARRNELYTELKETPGVQGIGSRHDQIDKLREALIETQHIFIGVLVGFSGVIFFGSIVNGSMVSLAERQREVATMRALGYGEWQIGAMFLRESMLVNLAGTLLGLPVGYGLTALTAASYANDLIRLPVVFESWIAASVLVISVIFALAAHGVIQWSIHRMNFVEALKVKE